MTSEWNIEHDWVGLEKLTGFCSTLPARAVCILLYLCTSISTGRRELVREPARRWQGRKRGHSLDGFHIYNNAKSRVCIPNFHWHAVPCIIT